MGVAIGSVVHSQVAALVGTLVWIFLVETLLVGLLALARQSKASAEYLPFRALDGADGTGGDNLLSLLACARRHAAAGSRCSAPPALVRTRRRDIT